MSRIHTELRAALETKLKSISDLPVIAWENSSFSPTTGVPYIRIKYIPLSQDPAHLGVLPQLRYEGIFRVDCRVPYGDGPFSGDDLAQDVLDAFRATTDLTTPSGIKLSIKYADREQGDKLKDGPFYNITVNIGWQCFN